MSNNMDRVIRNGLRSILLLIVSIFALSATLATTGSSQTPSAKTVSKGIILNVDGAISPATADYLVRGIQRAHLIGASIIIIKMDTPGGLDKSMRSIIKSIIASPVPVVTFVAPSGARAASAGTYILYASHVAAMAPATNLGAATPVSIGGGSDNIPGQDKEKTPEADKTQKKSAGEKDKSTAADKSMPDDAMKHKVINDAAAYIKSLADLHGRNAIWAVKAVREAASLSAEEALKENVIDLIASDVNDLLKKIEGRIVTVNGQKQTLALADANVEIVTPDWRTQFLSVITDPSVAYVLLMLGIYGIFFEFANPGFVVPGVVGAVCILLAMYALQLLPINFAGLALLILGIIFMLLEAIIPSFGALGVGGVIAFVAGSILLIDTTLPGYGVSWAVIGLVAVANACFFFGMIAMAMRARNRAVVSGKEAMIGMLGVSLAAINEEGQVRVHSEIWQARVTRPVKAGQAIRVCAMNGLVLTVEPIDE